MNNINHKGATMSNPNPIVLLSEFGLVLYQQGDRFILNSVEGEAFYFSCGEAFANYWRLSAKSRQVDELVWELHEQINEQA